MVFCLAIFKMLSGEWPRFLKKYQLPSSEYDSCESKRKLHVLFDGKTCGRRPFLSFSRQKHGCSIYDISCIRSVTL